MNKINNNFFLLIKYFGILGIVLGVCCTAGTLTAQAQKMPDQLINSAKKVTFDRSISFSRAIDILSQFSQTFTGKPIINHSNVKGNIGFSIAPTSWRHALQLILAANNLQLLSHPDYYEIVHAKAKNQSGVIGSTLPDTLLTTHSKGVKIDAIFFEANRKALREIGVDWSTLTSNVPANLQQLVNRKGGGGGGQNTQLPLKFQAPFVSVNAKGAKSVSQNIFNALINFGEVFGSGISVQALFSALSSDNLGKQLSSPSIRVLNGEKGHIQVGENIPINTQDFAGNTITRMISAGTILDVTPHIITYHDTTFIHLDIDANKSSASQTATRPIIHKQEAKTQVLLLNHESTVIAGLYTTEATKVRKGIPILKNLPPWFFGLRYLFGYNKKEHQTEELIILIKASIVPGIAERINKRLPGEFDVLKNAKNRVDNKVKLFKEKINQKDPSLLRHPSAENSIENEASKQGNLNPKPEAQTKEQPEIEHLNKSKSFNPETLEPVKIQPAKIPAVKQRVRYNPAPSKNHQYRYYVIGGAFRKKIKAKIFKLKAVEKGYQPEILKQQDKGYYIVALKGFDYLGPARAFRAKVASNYIPDAWIYRKR